MTDTQPNDMTDNNTETPYLWASAEDWSQFIEDLDDGFLYGFLRDYAGEIGYGYDVMEGILESFCEDWIDEKKQECAEEVTVDAPRAVYWLESEAEDAARQVIEDGMGAEEAIEYADLCRDPESIPDHCRQIDGFEDGIVQWLHDCKVTAKFLKLVTECYPNTQKTNA